MIGKKGCGTSFVYANAVVAGVAIFEEVLNQNGYIGYLTAQKKNEMPKHIRCSTCGIPYDKHTNKDHQYHPSCYITLTGENEASDTKNKDIIQRGGAVSSLHRAAPRGLRGRATARTPRGQP